MNKFTINSYLIPTVEKILGIENLSIRRDDDIGKATTFKGYTIKDGGIFGSYRERETTRYIDRLFCSFTKNGRRFGIIVSPREFVESREFDFVGDGFVELNGKVYPYLLKFNYRGVDYEISPEKLISYLVEKISPVS